jgi:anti-sigma factor RsiW
MSCHYESELTAYVDGALSATEVRTLEMHLPGCDACTDTLSLLRRTIPRIEALSPPNPGVELRRTVLARVEEARKSAARPLRARFAEMFRPRAVLGWAGGAGLLTAVVVAVILRAAPRSSVEDTPPWQWEVATQMDVVNDYEVVGLTELEDLEVIQHLQELEDTP